MRYTDRSRTETDWICPRARYWGYEHGGRGITPVEENGALSFGIVIAQAAEAIRLGQTVDLTALGNTNQTVLAMGLTEAYRTRIWPKWLEEFELVGTEVECVLKLSPDLTYMARPDAIIKRKADGTHWYLEDKTLGQSPENWVKQWDKKVQIHATALAIEATTGLEISGAYVQGWAKGYEKSGTIYSPLAFAWCKEGQPGLSSDLWSQIYKPGWTRRPISLYGLGVPGWVRLLNTDLLQQQFPLAGPIGLRRDLGQAYLQQVINREVEIEGCLRYDEQQACRAHFPQHFNNCDEFSVYRRPCAFKDACWAPTVGRDPVASGLYVVRTLHHKGEVINEREAIGRSDSTRNLL